MAFCAVFTAFLATISAAGAVFQVDPARSSVVMSGTMAGFAIQEQGPGSLRTTTSGSLAANVSGNAVSFGPGSALDAITNGVWQPFTDGTTGSAPADLAALLTTPFGAARVALRNIILDVSGGPLPLNNGSFPASGIEFTIPTNSNARLDFNAGAFGSDSQALSGSARNSATAAATLSGRIGMRTLTIPVDATFIFDALSEGDSRVRFVGQIVATEQAPPPSPRFVKVEVAGNQVRMHAQNAGPEARLVSTTNFAQWAERAATVAVEGDLRVYSVAPTAQREFFRLVVP